MGTRDTLARCVLRAPKIGGYFNRHEPCILGKTMTITRERTRWAYNVVAGVGTACAVIVATCCFLYPGVKLVGLAHDAGIHRDGQPSDFALRFRETARQYRSWAQRYLESRRAEQVHKDDVAGTEWPLFGTVFFLATAEELIDAGQLGRDGEMMAALDVAAEVVLAPSTAAWVKGKWGDDYHSKGNVFYRMLVLHGLTSFERASSDTRYHAIARAQAQALAAELMSAKYHLADDYPGECYPTDVLWAVAAIHRVLGDEAAPLVGQFMAVLDGPLLTRYGLPAFEVNSETAEIYQGPRGSGNSGMLSFAGELDAVMARRWYEAYTKHHWVDGFVSGFREVPRGAADVTDVDSGPVILGMGSVASLFGIGAARASGRFDHAAVLSLQVLSVSWPTPWGLLVPGAMGWLAADGWCFGELALSFAMTRPTYGQGTVSHDGSVPPLTWLMIASYLGTGTLILVREVRYWRARLLSDRRSPSA